MLLLIDDITGTRDSLLLSYDKTVIDNDLILSQLANSLGTREPVTYKTMKVDEELAWDYMLNSPGNCYKIDLP